MGKEVGRWSGFPFRVSANFQGRNGELFNFHRIGLSGTIDDSGQGMITEERLQEFLGEFCFLHGQKMRKKIKPTEKNGNKDVNLFFPSVVFVRVHVRVSGGSYGMLMFFLMAVGLVDPCVLWTWLGLFKKSCKTRLIWDASRCFGLKARGFFSMYCVGVLGKNPWRQRPYCSMTFGGRAMELGMIDDDMFLYFCTPALLGSYPPSNNRT